MLQAAASAVPTSLALTSAPQTATAENLEIPAGFAALLALGLSAVGEAEATVSTVAEQATPGDRQNGKGTGKTSGKTGGNILPVMPREGEMTLAVPAEPATDAELSVTDEAAPVRDDLPPEPVFAAIVPTPLAIALALPIPIATPRAPSSTPTPASDATIAAQAAPPPAATPEAPITPAAASTAVPAAATASTPVIAMPVVAMPATTAEPDPAASIAAKADNAPTQPLPIADMVKLAQAPQPAQKPEPATQMPVPVAAPVAMPQPDQAAKPASSRPSAAPAAPARETTVAPTRNAAIASDISALDPVKPLAAELQPVIALRDAQPAAQISANPPVVTSANTAPQQAGHDFAALVERLVEARDALAPQTVRAAIHHSEFGQVSLRFQSDDNHLTVSMTSADPDFAPSVQAAAAAQPSATTDNGASNHRQDTQGQQSGSQQPGSAASGQSQAQSQGSARSAGRDRSENFHQPANGEAAQEKARPRAGRSGIYA